MWSLPCKCAKPKVALCPVHSRLKLVSAMLRDAVPREDDPELRRALLDSLKDLERQQAAHTPHPPPPAPHAESRPAPQEAPRPPQHAPAPARPSAAEPRRVPTAAAAEAAEWRSGSAAAQELPARAPAAPSAPPLPHEAPSAPPMPAGGPGPSRAGDPSPHECQIVRDLARLHTAA